MDQKHIYVLTDRGTVGDTRWITCEVRDPEDHSCHGVAVYKQIYIKIGTNTISYRTETSADFPITDADVKKLGRIMFDHDDDWRVGPGTQIGPPKPLKYVLKG